MQRGALGSTSAHGRLASVAGLLFALGCSGRTSLGALPSAGGAVGAGGSAATSGGAAGRRAGSDPDAAGANSAGAPEPNPAGAGGIADQPPPTDDAPPTFEGITQVDVGSTQVTLHWDPATDDITTEPDFVYRIYAATKSLTFDLGAPGAISPPGATSFVVQNLPSNTTVYLLVLAQDLAGNASQTFHPVSVTTLVSLAFDVQPIFTASCAGTNCHGLGIRFANVELDNADDSFASLVNVPAKVDGYSDSRTTCVSSGMFVVPGDREASYLWKVLAEPEQIESLADPACTPDAGSVPCTPPSCAEVSGYCTGDGLCSVFGLLGTRMPDRVGTTTLPTETLELIGKWIDQGALDD